jgi:Uma2 family endonuclease
MGTAERYAETITLPRAVRFPVELIPPEGFDEERLETWPRIAGRLECVGGRLFYMPPSGDLQQDTTADVVMALGAWIRAHPRFVLGTNEAGMRLGGATRAADAAVWCRADLRGYRGGLRRVPPVLAVEVAGQDETEDALRAKAVWYREVGVAMVWLVLPERREVVVFRGAHETRHLAGETLPADPELPDLAVRVDDLFTQLSGDLAKLGVAPAAGSPGRASAARRRRQRRETPPHSRAR